MDDAQHGSFGAHLRRYREAAGLTQEELAERAGLASAAISALERGLRQRPYPHTVKVLAGALGLSPGERATLEAAVPKRSPAAGPGAAPPPPPALPVPLTPVIGRAHELAAILRLLTGEGVRLVTLTGPGGIGKTRLAIQAAADAAGRFAHGAVLVPLATVTDPGLVLGCIAQALGLPPMPEQRIAVAVQSYFRDRQVLLVLDNLEQLSAAAADIAQLLAACPRLSLLCTSRAPLRLRGERVYPLPPLALPGLAQLPAVEEVARAASVELFVQRAREALPGFELTQRNAGAVAAICRRLDGLPLALELAAARVRLLSPAALLSRLDSVLPMLTGGARDLPERQQTMQQTIAWSYNLLEPAQQALFRHLAVFLGGWTWEAAEAIDVGHGQANGETLDRLTALVDQSLVLVERDGEEPRYRMLEPIREYAAHLLEQSGESAALRDRHAAHFLLFAESAGLWSVRRDQIIWLDRFDADHDNLGAALEWLLGREHLEEAARMCWALHRYWWTRGHLVEGRIWTERVLERADALPQAMRARALFTAGMVMYGQGQSSWYDRARLLFDESIALLEAGGDQSLLAQALTLRGYSLIRLGDRAGMEESFARGLSLFRQLGHPGGEGVALHGQGLGALFAGDHDRAWALLREAEAARRAADMPADIANCLNLLGLIATMRGEYALAEQLLREGLTLMALVRDRWGMVYALPLLAGLMVARSDYLRGAWLFGVAESLRETTGVEIHLPPTRDMFEQQIAVARANLDPAAFAIAWSEGRAMTLEQAVANALQEE